MTQYVSCGTLKNNPCSSFIIVTVSMLNCDDVCMFIVAVRNVKGVKSRVGYMWNYLITSPWVGQAIIELSIAAAVIPYSYLSLISTVSFVALTKIVPLLY
jgi:hypothetical protein